MMTSLLLCATRIPQSTIACAASPPPTTPASPRPPPLSSPHHARAQLPPTARRSARSRGRSTANCPLHQRRASGPGSRARRARRRFLRASLQASSLLAALPILHREPPRPARLTRTRIPLSLRAAESPAHTRATAESEERPPALTDRHAPGA